jgi:pterin-4a-carbinolamine dehydratase
MLTRPAPARQIIDEPLELVDDFEETTPAPQATPGHTGVTTAVATDPHKSKIHGISAGPSHAAHSYTRSTHSNKTGAVRMRTFHCRLSEQGVEYLDQSINDWLEHHPDIEVKFTTSTVGLWDGKLKEPTLILNVWY